MPLSPRKAARERQLGNLRRGGTPAPPGNQRARVHGGYAAVAALRLDEQRRRIAEALAGDTPLRDEAGELPRADGALVTLLARCLARLEDVEQYLRDHGWCAENGDPRSSIIELEARLRREAADYMDALGMSPRSRVKLGVELSQAADSAHARWVATATREELLEELVGIDPCLVPKIGGD
jgi:hypothetical protein